MFYTDNKGSVKHNIDAGDNFGIQHSSYETDLFYKFFIVVPNNTLPPLEKHNIVFFL